MSEICPQCGNDIYATSAEHRCSDFVMPYMQPKSSKKMAMIDPDELAALRSQLDAVTKERDEYRTRAQVAESDIGRCICQAKATVPDYPWHTAVKGCEHSTASWALVGSLEGTRLANDDLHAELQASDAACAGMREALGNLVGAQSSCDEPFEERWCSVHNSKGCEMNRIIAEARAALADPHGTALLERLKLAEAVCEVAQWMENGGTWPQTYAHLLAAWRKSEDDPCRPKPE